MDGGIAIQFGLDLRVLRSLFSTSDQSSRQHGTNVGHVTDVLLCSASDSGRITRSLSMVLSRHPSITALVPSTRNNLVAAGRSLARAVRHASFGPRDATSR